MRSCGRRLLSVGLTAAALTAALGAPPLQAQSPATSGGATAAPPGSAQPGAVPITKALHDLAPKSIVVDPCKSANPPPYCAKH